MSVKLNYGTSELIEQLPLSQEPLHPIDYARIAPLLDEGSKLAHPLKRYVIAMLLFFVCSLSLIDELIKRISPALGQLKYITLLVKSVFFGVILYLCDHFIQQS